MKRMFLVLLILSITAGFTMAVDVHEYGAIKAGYGNETGGTRVGFEAKINNFGISGGIGAFNGEACWSLGAKGFIDFNDKYSMYGGLNYGILGYEWSSRDDEYIYLYAPYFMVGLVYVGETGWYSDAALGYGKTDTDYWGQIESPTGQFSIGYAWN